MVSIIDYKDFTEELKHTVYKNAKADLINKVADNPDRYVGIFRPTSPELKLIQNVTQSHEISFGDFIEDIITLYLGHYYINLPKRAIYNGEVILFDQLFEYNNTIFMIEQKMRDDHDSTKKRGQFDNFLKKVEYLKETYPNKKIEAGMWFVDQSLVKNKRYYSQKIEENQNNGAKLNLFYGPEFTEYLEKKQIWDEMTEHLLAWKMSEESNIQLNFEEDWKETKEELLNGVTKNSWRKIINNKQVVDEILPILFPTGKYKEILKEIGL